MSYEAALGLLSAAWVTGWCFGYKFRQIADVLAAC